MATLTNGTHNASTPKIKLYTNHGCPFAHRAHITLEELKLPYEEVLIDLETPRPQWYLDVNPRGLVPAIKYGEKEEIITESAVVAQFFMDLYPSHLLPASGSDPLRRARINYFLDTWNSKGAGMWFGIVAKDSPEAKEEAVDNYIKILEKEIEPLLTDASPFFGGSKDLTAVEVMAAPFILRFYSVARDNELVPASAITKVDKLPNFSKWAKAIIEHPSVLTIYDEQKQLEGFKKKFQAAAKHQ